MSFIEYIEDEEDSNWVYEDMDSHYDHHTETPEWHIRTITNKVSPNSYYELVNPDNVLRISKKRSKNPGEVIPDSTTNTSKILRDIRRGMSIKQCILNFRGDFGNYLEVIIRDLNDVSLLRWTLDNVPITKSEPKLKKGQNIWDIKGDFPGFEKTTYEFLQLCLLDKIDVKFLIEFLNFYKQNGVLDNPKRRRIISIAFHGSTYKNGSSIIKKLRIIHESGFEIFLSTNFMQELSISQFISEDVDFLIKYCNQSLIIAYFYRAFRILDVDVLIKNYHPEFTNSHEGLISAIEMLNPKYIRLSSNRDFIDLFNFTPYFWETHPKIAPRVFNDALGGYLVGINFLIDSHMPMGKYREFIIKKYIESPLVLYNIPFIECKSIELDFYFQISENIYDKRNQVIDNKILRNVISLYILVSKTKKGQFGEIVIRDPIINILINLPSEIYYNIFPVMFSRLDLRNKCRKFMLFYDSNF